MKLKLSSEHIENLITRFPRDSWIENVTLAGKLVNFTVNKQKLLRHIVPVVLQKNDKYGENLSGAGKKIIIEYSSPNIAKPFHAGHLRSTIIGNFLKNVYRANGWEVISMNYLGDWGKQYGLLCIGFEMFGDEEKLNDNPIAHLFEVYGKIWALGVNDESVHHRAREYFKKLEDGDEAVVSLWSKFRNLSIEKYREIYARLNVQFDVYDGESQVPQNAIDSALAKLKQLGLLIADDGAMITPLKEFGLGNAILQKSDGTTIYLARDIGAALTRYEKYKFDKMLYVVATPQAHHFSQLFKILDLLGFEKSADLHHVNFGMINGMSTRRGNVVFLDDMLDTTRDKMHEVMRENEVKYAGITDPLVVAEKVGNSAIYIQDMSAKRIKDYDFNWKRMLSFEGSTGPYLQYAHARLSSIVRETGITPQDLDISTIDFSLITEDEMHAIVNLVADYPVIIHRLTETMEPSTVVHYAMSLSQAVAKAWKGIYVKNRERNVAEARSCVYGAARITLGNALRLLGLEPLEKM